MHSGNKQMNSGWYLWVLCVFTYDFAPIERKQINNMRNIEKKKQTRDQQTEQ